MDKDALIEHLTETVLVDRGYDRDDDDLDIEWDGNNPDSQYSLVREDVAIIIEALDQLFGADTSPWDLVKKL
jgi:hypothetical protein